LYRIANVWVKGGKVKFTLETAMKVQRQNRTIDLLFL